jgi:hypothetical protein
MRPTQSQGQFLITQKIISGPLALSDADRGRVDRRRPILDADPPAGGSVLQPE